MIRDSMKIECSWARRARNPARSISVGDELLIIDRDTLEIVAVVQV